MYSSVISFIRETFRQQEDFIPLHAPYFGGNEKQYLMDTIDSTFVSSVGAYVNRFEKMMQDITGAKHAIAMTNGTTALQLALSVSGASHDTEVITQPLTFVATANAIAHCGASPVFVDVDRDTMGMSPDALRHFLEMSTEIREDGCFNKLTGKKIVACVPMHTFGFPCRITAIADICRAFGLVLVEDAAESLGSYYGDQHTGTFGSMGTFSFNGNKTVTCGGGGAIITNDDKLAARLKHLSTTAKVPHPWEFAHDEVGYNYRMPNLNAALACAQLEQLRTILDNKKQLANIYADYFANGDIKLVNAIAPGIANNWLNTVVLPDTEAKDIFLKQTNEHQVMTRPIWKLMNKLPMYAHCQHGPLDNAQWLEDRVVNIPSSFRPFVTNADETALHMETIGLIR